MNNMISINRAAMNAAEDVGSEEIDRLLIKRWCAEAEKEIGGRYQYEIERHVLDLDSSQLFATLPCETFNVMAVFPGNVGKDCSLSWGGKASGLPGGFDPTWSRTDWEQGVGITIITGSKYETAYEADFEVINNRLQFSCKVTGHSQVTVYLMRYQTDTSGWIMVAEEHAEAIGYYVKRMIGERSLFNAKPMPMNAIDYFRREWGKKSSIARGKTSRLTPAEQQSLSEMVNNPISGKVINYGVITQLVQ